MSEWISVDDGLPENKTSVIAFGFDLDGGRVFHSWFEDGRFNLLYDFEYDEDDVIMTKNTTHWMPLPETPK